jgi:anion-transporting  ArsA/GET3 family ATPase
LLGIPGIDEATTLANVISYIESGEYDVIVFDTAPTAQAAQPPLLQLEQF